MNNIPVEELIITKYFKYVSEDFPNKELMYNIIDRLNRKNFNVKFLYQNGKDIREFVELLMAYMNDEYKEIDRRKVILLVALLLYLTDPPVLISEDTPSSSSNLSTAKIVIDLVYEELESNLSYFWEYKFSNGKLFKDGEISVDIMRQHPIYNKANNYGINHNQENIKSSRTKSVLEDIESNLERFNSFSTTNNMYNTENIHNAKNIYNTKNIHDNEAVNETEIYLNNNGDWLNEKIDSNFNCDWSNKKIDE